MYCIMSEKCLQQNNNRGKRLEGFGGIHALSIEGFRAITMYVIPMSCRKRHIRQFLAETFRMVYSARL
jgi:hypothetical protein